MAEALVAPGFARLPRLAFDELADDGHALAGALVLLDFIHRANRLVLRHRLPHFRQREVLELPDAFAGHVEFLADLFQRKLFAAFEAEAQLDDLRLALVEG